MNHHESHILISHVSNFTKYSLNRYVRTYHEEEDKSSTKTIHTVYEMFLKYTKYF